MRKTKGIKIVCRCLITLCLLAISLKALTGLMERKESDFKYRPYFAQEEDFDILFLGTSHVINAVFPMELWHDYGLVSYNFGGHGNALATSYWVMKNALDYTTPRLMVIDCYFLGGNTKTSSFFQVHQSMDTFPLSFTKVSSALDLLDDDVVKEKEAAGDIADADQRTYMSLLWDYSVYHSRWNELIASDFDKAGSREKGAESRIAVSTPVEIPDVPPNRKLEEDTVAVAYLCKIIEECKSRGIEVLLTYLPFPSTEAAQMEANRVSDIAEQYDVNYINFLDMELVNYGTDCYDPSSHLNPSGARKVTDYLGEYISSHYDIPDRRQQTEYSGWHNDYADYQDFKAENLKKQSSLDSYLMLLADKNYDVMFEIQDASIWNNDYYVSLLENLGINARQIKKKTDAILVQEAGRQVDYFKQFCTSQDSFRTAAGVVKTMLSEDGSRSVCLDGETLYCVPAGQDENTDIRIVVFDKDTRAEVDHVWFSLQNKDDIGDEYIAVTSVNRP